MTKLLPHQIAAVEKLRHVKAGALFMEQGTGKTATALELIRIRREAGKVDAVIWLCPCSAKENIRREIVKCADPSLLSCVTICGIETLSTSIRAITYLINKASSKRCFLVVDESLMVKNPGAYRTEHITKISELCQYKLILNGTPISRNEADLFAQFYILDWRILGYRSYYSFAANHIEYGDDGRIYRVLNVDRLTKKIEPYTFQIRKDECLVLPEKWHRYHSFRLTPEQEYHYEQVGDELLMSVDELKPETIYRLFAGLQAVVSGKEVEFVSKDHFETHEFFGDPLDNPRIQALRDVLTDEKTIIFCHYQSEIQHLCKVLKSAVPFYGAMSQKERTDALERFRDEATYLVANKNCAGYSLNLQFCHRIVYLSNDWDLGTRLQSEDRVHRIGQTEDVIITDIYAAGTIDETIMKCIAGKENLLERIKSSISSKELLKKLMKGETDGKTLLKEECLGSDSGTS